MGTWGPGLYANDTTCDIRDTYMELLMDQVEDEAAYQQMLDQFKEYMDDEDEAPLFWYALAESQWKTGRLLPEVKEKALWWIERNGGIEPWLESSSKGAGWKKTLQKLKDKLESPQPKRKTVRRPEPINNNPWNLNDIYAYQFHENNKYSEHNPEAYLGKYIVLQKIGEGEKRYGNGTVAMRVQVYDKIFDTLPSLSDLEGLRLLPLDQPTRHNISHESNGFQKDPVWMSSLIDAYTKRDYPRKHLSFLGNQPGPSNHQEPEYWWGLESLSWGPQFENALRFYHQQWSGIEYDIIGDGLFDYVPLEQK